MCQLAAECRLDPNVMIRFMAGMPAWKRVGKCMSGVVSPHRVFAGRPRGGTSTCYEIKRTSCAKVSTWRAASAGAACNRKWGASISTIRVSGLSLEIS